MSTSTEEKVVEPDEEKLWALFTEIFKDKQKTIAFFQNCALRPDYPERWMKLSALCIEGSSHVRYRSDSCFGCFESSFWQTVCSDYSYRYTTGKKRLFEQICGKSPVSTVAVVLKQFLKQEGAILPERHALEYIYYVWRDYFEEVCKGSVSEEVDWDVLVPKVSSLEDLESTSSGLHAAWQKTELLIRATQTDAMSKSREELHLVSLMIQLGVSKVLVWLALRLFPKQANLRDSRGRIPLHWAAIHCENSKSLDESRFHWACSTNAEMRNQFPSKRITGTTADILSGQSMVEVVLDVFPDGAGYQDAEGSVPLVHLLNLKYIKVEDGDMIVQSALALAKKAPQTLTTANQPNQMLPFMTAACELPSPLDIDRDAKSRLMHQKFNFTFRLLMADPTVVTRGIKASDREIWLTEKLDKAQCHIQDLREENRKLREHMERISQSTAAAEVPRVAPIQLYNLPSTKPTGSLERQKISQATNPPQATS